MSIPLISNCKYSIAQRVSSTADAIVMRSHLVPCCQLALVLPAQNFQQSHHPPSQLHQILLRYRILSLTLRLPVSLLRNQTFHDTEKGHLELLQLFRRSSHHLLASLVYLSVIHLQLLLLAQLVLLRRVDVTAQRTQHTVQPLPAFLSARKSLLELLAPVPPLSLVVVLRREEVTNSVHEVGV